MEEERQKNRCRPAVTLRLMGVAGDLCVARRRRCPCIAFSLLLDLAWQDPSANVTISMKRDTHVPYSTFAGADPQAGAPARGATHSGRRFRRFVTRTYA